MYVSAKIAELTGDKTTYIKNRAFNKERYKKMVISFLKQYKETSRHDIDELLFDKLSDTLRDEQKKKYIGNLLYEMSIDTSSYRSKKKTSIKSKVDVFFMASKVIFI
ncbi:MULTISPECIES: hypothetical protein [unclassified Bacillus (in: firmicutes)]|uniref:hypothetical protein n=1 Tax=unclassified Bacillus (in: firmicutes) TaxID=185979 RepID=UPI0020D2872F|nr:MULTISPECIES: hypothetical protein [unclassified Bacillus (in: firmicutes)]